MFCVYEGLSIEVFLEPSVAKQKTFMKGCLSLKLECTKWQEKSYNHLKAK